MLSAHTVAVTVIAVTYFGSMAALFAYMACQVRDREQPPGEDDGTADPDGEPGMRFAALRWSRAATAAGPATGEHPPP